MNGLVVGSGGREHALAQALQASLKLERVYVAPGNGGTENNVPINDDDVGELADFASKNDCFTIVGPETAITAGITNEFAKKDLPISSSLIGTLFSVPPFPGATYTRSNFRLACSACARACSRPPEPTTSPFTGAHISILYIIQQ